GAGETSRWSSSLTPSSAWPRPARAVCGSGTNLLPGPHTELPDASPPRTSAGAGEPAGLLPSACPGWNSICDNAGGIPEPTVSPHPGGEGGRHDSAGGDGTHRVLAQPGQPLPQSVRQKGSTPGVFRGDGPVPRGGGLAVHLLSPDGRSGSGRRRTARPLGR